MAYTGWLLIVQIVKNNIMVKIGDLVFTLKDNKVLCFKEDVISITSNYDIDGCAYLLVKGGEIKNQKLIKNRTASGIIMYPSVVFDKHNPPSEVYLIDPNPRADTKEWLIYKS